MMKQNNVAVAMRQFDTAFNIQNSTGGNNDQHKVIQHGNMMIIFDVVAEINIRHDLMRRPEE